TQSGHWHRNFAVTHKQHRRETCWTEGKSNEATEIHRTSRQLTGLSRTIEGFDRSRSATRRAISADASTGIGNTELTLISPSTYLSLPSGPGGPSMKSASQIIGRSRCGIASKEASCGVPSSSINRRRRWKRGSALDV